MDNIRNLQPPFEIVETLSIDNAIISGALDRFKGFAYFGISNPPPFNATILKIRLSDFTEIARLDLRPGQKSPESCTIDDINGYLYVGTRDQLFSPSSRIVKIKLSDFTIDSELDIGSFFPGSAQIDIENQIAYFGDGSGSPTVLKIDLNTFASIGTLILDDNYPKAMSLDNVNRFLYTGVNRSDANGTITKVNVNTGEKISTIIGEFNSHVASSIDINGGHVYFGGRNAMFDLSAIWTVNLSDLSIPFTITVPGGFANTSAIDIVRGYVYFTVTANHSIYRISLVDNTFTTLPITPIGSYTVALADVNGGFLFIATSDSPATIYKIRIGNPLLGSLSISSIPTGANIYIDNIQIGVTPLSIDNLTAQTHSYKLTFAGYQDTSGDVYILPGSNTLSTITLLPNPGNVTVTSIPPGASIIIDNVAQGITPNTISDLTHGSHTYKLTLTGYNIATGSFEIVSDQTTNLDVELVETTSSVFINSTPAGATIYIRDVIQPGIVTPAPINLSPGIYTHRLALSGYYDASGNFEVFSGQTTDINVTLQPIVAQAGFRDGSLLLLAGLGTGLLFLAAGRRKEDTPTQRKD